MVMACLVSSVPEESFESNLYSISMTTVSIFFWSPPPERLSSYRISFIIFLSV